MADRSVRIRLLITGVAPVALVAALAACGGAAAGRPDAAAPSAAAPAAVSPVPAPPVAPQPVAVPPAASPSASSARPVRYVFPVRGNASYARVHHDYAATDIMAACGAPVVAVTGGTVLDVTTVDRYSAKVNAGATRGGLSVSILGDDGVRYYGSHFSAIAAGVAPGRRVAAGDPLGKIGRTGDASACHLHFGISPPCRRTGDWWIQRGMIWPWPYLDSWRAGGHKSAVAEIAALGTGAKGCPDHPLTDP